MQNHKKARGFWRMDDLLYLAEVLVGWGGGGCGWLAGAWRTSMVTHGSLCPRCRKLQFFQGSVVGKLFKTSRFQTMSVCLTLPAAATYIWTAIFSFYPGCNLHLEHSADQCQCPAAGTARKKPPSAATAGYARLSGASRPHRKSMKATWPMDSGKWLRGCAQGLVSLWLMTYFFVLKVEELNRLNIIHVTGTKGKVS